jgi:hypothetical protein
MDLLNVNRRPSRYFIPVTIHLLLAANISFAQSVKGGRTIGGIQVEKTCSCPNPRGRRC